MPHSTSSVKHFRRNCLGQPNGRRKPAGKACLPAGLRRPFANRWPKVIQPRREVAGPRGVSVIAEDLATLRRAQGSPGAEKNSVADEADGAIAQGNVDALGVAAAGGLIDGGIGSSIGAGRVATATLSTRPGPMLLPMPP